jgi:hypothetical protein
MLQPNGCGHIFVVRGCSTAAEYKHSTQFADYINNSEIF